MRPSRAGCSVRSFKMSSPASAMIGLPIYCSSPRSGNGVLKVRRSWSSSSSSIAWDGASSNVCEESRALGERVAASKQHIAAGGWYFPGRVPWGYRLRPASPEERSQGAPASVLEPDPDTSPWVQEAFSRATGGESIRAVHRWVTALPDPARGERVLTYRAVSLVLASPVYIARA